MKRRVTMKEVQNSRPSIVSLTDKAAERVRDIIANHPGSKGLKIGLKKGGCAGMEYTLRVVHESDKYDEVVEFAGATVFIDPMATLYIIGTEIDYKIDKLSSQFIFNTPNQTSTCGCGESVELEPQNGTSLVGV